MCRKVVDAVLAHSDRWSVRIFTRDIRRRADAGLRHVSTRGSGGLRVWLGFCLPDASSLGFDTSAVAS